MRLDYVLRRILQLGIMLWGAATLNFLLPRLAPGNPVRERLLNAMAQVTALAINLGTIVSGLVVVDVVFGYPGIGSLLFRAINGLDYFVIYGVLFMTVLAIALATITIDLLSPILDSRSDVPSDPGTGA